MRPRFAVKDNIGWEEGTRQRRGSHNGATRFIPLQSLHFSAH